MKNRKNIRKENFLGSIPTASLDSTTNLFAKKCKINFSYYDDNQAAANSFSDLTSQQLCRLIEKLKNFCEESLIHWSNQRIGGANNRVFSIYGGFPSRSEYKHPKHVPHQAQWARFRLEGDMRLIGFVVPDDYHDKLCKHSGMRFDKNSFYIVFLDLNHKFYLSKKNN